MVKSDQIDIELRNRYNLIFRTEDPVIPDRVWLSVIHYSAFDNQ